MTPDTPHDPKGAAGKLKPQLHLLPPIFCTETAAALSDGARKYGGFNWRRTGSRINRSTYISAILRHAMAIQNGEDRCQESGVTHLGHIAANCAILLDAEMCGTLEDDRVLLNPVPSKSPSQLANAIAYARQVPATFGSPLDYSPLFQSPVAQDNLPAINQSLRETNAAHEKTITELGELLRKTTEERDTALAAVRPAEVEWHNPAGVDSPGEDFRFLLKTEVVVPEDGEVWNTKDRWYISGNRGDVRHEPSTYRTRQPLPTV